jgi:hypothetical protein
MWPSWLNALDLLVWHGPDIYTPRLHGPEIYEQVPGIRYKHLWLTLSKSHLALALHPFCESALLPSLLNRGENTTL